MSVVVSELSSADEGAWDAFVRGSPDALPHHLLGWREAITRTYGHRPRYLVAKNEGNVVGVMPLFEGTTFRRYRGGSARRRRRRGTRWCSGRRSW